MIFPKNSDVMAQGRAREYVNNYNHILLKWCQEFGTSLTVLADALKHVLNIGVDPNTAFESYNILRNYTGTLLAPQAPTLGSELVVNGGFDSADGWTLAASGTATAPTISSGELSFASTGSNYTYCRRNLNNTLVVGKTYKISVTCTAHTAGQFNIVMLGGTVQIPLTITSGGPKYVYFTPISANTGVEISRQGTASQYTASFDNISVREVIPVNVYSDSTGSTPAVKDGVIGRINCLAGSALYATQSTAGYKPILRWGAKNLLTYSEDFSNAAWVKTDGDGVTLTSNVVVSPDGFTTADKCTVLSGTAAASTIVHRTNSVTAGLTYTVSCYLKAAELGYAHLALVSGFPTTALSVNLSTGAVSAANGTGAPLNAVSQSAGNGWWRLSYSLLATSTIADNQVVVYLSSDGLWVHRASAKTSGSGIYIWGAMIETGSTASPYVATTSAPASNGIGPAWMDFDGVDDRLQLSAVPFQMADDHFIIASVKQFGSLATCVFAERSTASDVPIVAKIMADTGGTLKTQHRDDAGTLTEALSSTSTVGNSFVLSGRKSGNNKYNRFNGTQGSANTTALGSSTVTVAAIGCSPTNTATQFWNGPIYGIALGKGTVTDSELKTVERYIGQLSGVTIV